MALCTIDIGVSMSWILNAVTYQEINSKMQFLTPVAMVNQLDSALAMEQIQSTGPTPTSIRPDHRILYSIAQGSRQVMRLFSLRLVGVRILIAWILLKAMH
jgi:hypothetical protein